jgi:urease accessory protein
VDHAARLRLFQLVSPALPVGAFSYSEGLELLVQRGAIAGVEALETWLVAELQRGAVAIETAALAPLAAAWRQWQQGVSDARALESLDGWLLGQREAPELRAQQRQMGQSLLQLLADLGWPLPGPVAPLAWPAAFAWAAVCLELDSPAIEEAYLYGWVANQISAAVRLVPLGPTQGQRLQLALAPLMAERAIHLAAADPHQLWNGGVGAGLAQLQHAELYSRLFRS